MQLRSESYGNKSLHVEGLFSMVLLTLFTYNTVIVHPCREAGRFGGFAVRIVPRSSSQANVFRWLEDDQTTSINGALMGLTAVF